MVKLNLTSFGLRRNLRRYYRLKITLNVLVVSYAKEFAAEEIIPSVKS